MPDLVNYLFSLMFGCNYGLSPTQKSWPPVPKQKETPLARTISEPDQPAPPPPRHGNDRQKNQRPPPPKVATPSEPDSDDSSSVSQKVARIQLIYCDMFNA